MAWNVSSDQPVICLRHSTSVAEEIRERDIADVQVFGGGGARMRCRKPAQLRNDGRRNEVLSRAATCSRCRFDVKSSQQAPRTAPHSWEGDYFKPHPTKSPR